MSAPSRVELDHEEVVLIIKMTEALADEESRRADFETCPMCDHEFYVGSDLAPQGSRNEMAIARELLFKLRRALA